MHWKTTIKKKIYVLVNGLSEAFKINLLFILSKLMRKKTIVFHCALTHFSHIKSIIERLCIDHLRHRYNIIILCPHKEIQSIKKKKFDKKIRYYSEYASRFVLFCDMILSIDQGMIYPWRKCKYQICLFHGQPSKGNSYIFFNPKGPNLLIFYGPLMRDYFLKEKLLHPEWPSIQYLEIGQPLSDMLFNDLPDKDNACKSFSINPDRYTILYAPSFEYCSSLATAGEEIIDCLLNENINLIFKPHPAFYKTYKSMDTTEKIEVNINDWITKISEYKKKDNFVFSYENNLNMQSAMAAADIMLTDYSGVAFDGILLDKKMIFWDCPKFFNEYLPQRYGLDPAKVKNDLACNAGRNAGIVVRDCNELVKAIKYYINNPDYLAKERADISQQLLFNPGKATEKLVNKIFELLEIDAI